VVLPVVVPSPRVLEQKPSEGGGKEEDGKGKEGKGKEEGGKDGDKEGKGKEEGEKDGKGKDGKGPATVLQKIQKWGDYE
jgi:hypothetical protein